MAESNCPRCGERRFEMVHAQIEGTSRSVLFVQCAECGAVVGALDFVNFGLQATSMRENIYRFADRVRWNLDHLSR